VTDGVFRSYMVKSQISGVTVTQLLSTALKPVRFGLETPRKQYVYVREVIK